MCRNYFSFLDGIGNVFLEFSKKLKILIFPKKYYHSSLPLFLSFLSIFHHKDALSPFFVLSRSLSLSSLYFPHSLVYWNCNIFGFSFKISPPQSSQNAHTLNSSKRVTPPSSTALFFFVFSSFLHIPLSYFLYFSGFSLQASLHPHTYTPKLPSRVRFIFFLLQQFLFPSSSTPFFPPNKDNAAFSCRHSSYEGVFSEVCACAALCNYSYVSHHTHTALLH